MKVVIISLVMMIITSFHLSGNGSYVYLFKAKSEEQASKVSKRFYSAGYYNPYFESQGYYYIEIEPEDVNLKVEGKHLDRLVIRRMQRRRIEKVYVFPILLENGDKLLGENGK